MLLKMLVHNLEKLNHWLKELYSSGYVFYRFDQYPVKYLDMDWQEELSKHANAFLEDPKHFTFHHIRLLFKELKNKKIKYPLVGTVQDQVINVNPGGSRLMVAKYYNVQEVPLDLICTKEEMSRYTVADYYIVNSIDKFLKVYHNINSDASVRFDDNGYGARYWYQMDYNNHFHWAKEDIDEWIKTNQYIRCQNILDYYFL